MESTGANWRKSSYSGGNGGACVEVGITWRKSSHSGSNGGNCLEAGTAAPRADVPGAEACEVAVRDTTNRAGTTLTFPPTAWRALLADLRLVTE
jgi:hypothetical protein